MYRKCIFSWTLVFTVAISFLSPVLGEDFPMVAMGIPVGVAQPICGEPSFFGVPDTGFDKALCLLEPGFSSQIIPNGPTSTAVVDAACGTFTFDTLLPAGLFDVYDGLSGNPTSKNATVSLSGVGGLNLNDSNFTIVPNDIGNSLLIPNIPPDLSGCGTDDGCAHPNICSDSAGNAFHTSDKVVILDVDGNPLEIPVEPPPGPEFSTLSWVGRIEEPNQVPDQTFQGFLKLPEPNTAPEHRRFLSKINRVAHASQESANITCTDFVDIRAYRFFRFPESWSGTNNGNSLIRFLDADGDQVGRIKFKDLHNNPKKAAEDLVHNVNRTNGNWKISDHFIGGVYKDYFVIWAKEPGAAGSNLKIQFTGGGSSHVVEVQTSITALSDNTEYALRHGGKTAIKFSRKFVDVGIRLRIVNSASGAPQGNDNQNSRMFPHETIFTNFTLGPEDAKIIKLYSGLQPWPQKVSCKNAAGDEVFLMIMAVGGFKEDGEFTIVPGDV